MLQKPKGELFLQSITNPGKERCFLSLCKMFLFFFMSRVVLISGLQAQEQFWEPRSLPRARWGRKLSSPAGFVPALRLSSIPLAPNPQKKQAGKQSTGSVSSRWSGSQNLSPVLGSFTLLRYSSG